MEDLERPAAGTAPFPNAGAHLEAELRWLAQVVAAHIAELRRHLDLTTDAFLGMTIPNQIVDAVLAPSDRPPARADAFALRRELDARVLVTRAREVELPLATAIERAGLDHFEAALLRLALAPLLDLRWESVLSLAQNDALRRLPTVDLALALFEDHGARHERLRWLHASQLVCDGWVRLEPNEQRPSHAVLGRQLVPCAEIVELVIGGPPYARDCLPLDSAPDVEVVSPASRAAARRHTQANRRGRIVIRGRDGTGRRALCADAARSIGRGVRMLDASRLAGQTPEQMDERLAALGRACVLHRECPVVHRADALVATTEGQRALRELARLAAPVFIVLEKGRLADAREVELAMPDGAARLALWRRSAPLVPEAILEYAASQFKLTPAQIAQASAKLDGQSLEHVIDAARTSCVHHLEALARRVPGRPTFEQLVVPAHVERQLRELVAACRHRHRVLHEWGFASRLSYGLGTYALFAGPSGTGKTFAASIIATSLGLPLFQVDLASVVSKYIGETERNLDRVFDEAEAASAMLVFDEADALFGARSEVTDARDRYANMEVAYLLQRMESYEGVVILTSNLRKNLDDAFARRIAHVIEFPFPDSTMRERLWRTTLPPEAPVEDELDLGRFARRFELSGGNIKNVLVAAAWLAAEEGTAIGSRHVLHATSRELQKLGRLSERALMSEMDLTG